MKKEELNIKISNSYYNPGEAPKMPQRPELHTKTPTVEEIEEYRIRLAVHKSEYDNYRRWIASYNDDKTRLAKEFKEDLFSLYLEENEIEKYRDFLEEMYGLACKYAGTKNLFVISEYFEEMFGLFDLMIIILKKENKA